MKYRSILLPPELMSERLRICQLSGADYDKVLYYYWENRPHFQSAMPAYHTQFFTPNFQKKLLEEQLKLTQNGKLLKFWLFKKGDSQKELIIGDISFSEIIRGAFQSCFLGYKMHHLFCQKGLMYEALSCLIPFVFEQYYLHRIEANIQPTNKASLRLIQKLTFQKEGFSLKYLKIDGQWKDHIRFALLNNDFS